MNSSEQKTVPTINPKIVFNQTFIQGRISSSKMYEGKQYTDIISPAPDLYSKPSEFTVCSNSALGAIGQEVQLNVILTGFLKHFTFVDKNTGQQKQGSKSSVYMNLIE